jgi:hypothetical protein
MVADMDVPIMDTAAAGIADGTAAGVGKNWKEGFGPLFLIKDRSLIERPTGWFW